jgi:hypothetical protein
MDDEVIEKVKQSIQYHGFEAPVVIEEQDDSVSVLEGDARLLALARLDDFQWVQEFDPEDE